MATNRVFSAFPRPYITPVERNANSIIGTRTFKFLNNFNGRRCRKLAEIGSFFQATETKANLSLFM